MFRSTTSRRSPKRQPTSGPIQTSYEDLKRPEARQMLKEQASDTFRGRPSLDSTTTRPGMPLKERFSRRSSTLDVTTSSLSAKSSSSSVEHDSSLHRTSTMPEDNQTIDLERAILLLQELKKTASPDELVALHRALLPTKEVDIVASPNVSSFEERAAHSASPA
ncbi:hypothetical protein LTR53_017587, partial [Teratosphaeriaceae sp. CCFEE 6253]